MSKTQNVELTPAEWNEIQIVLDEYDIPDMDESERTNLKIISAKIDLERRNYGGRCYHEYGKISSTRCVTMSTRETPAEYESEAECLICGETVDAQDVEHILD